MDAHLAARPFQLDEALPETDCLWCHQLQKLRWRCGCSRDWPYWRGRFHHALQLAILQALPERDLSERDLPEPRDSTPAGLNSTLADVAPPA